ncbi:cyanophycinase [Parvularcula sp. ZS-1/3]|uniref:Cyanophycinase n=1 Tax=Parvularcula mediterranea TaxID=2732508 RepID=A0A7Y3W3S9_9PROT|nr:cyanophycinase [Parvularcula mediterranea]NNU14769.1 cyanophycinase [Parvularcula mediterranea]
MPLRSFAKPSKKAANLKYAIIGGRLEDDNRRVYREMRRLCGGRILIFPTASSEPVEVGEETLEVFQSHGFQAEVMMVTEDNGPMTVHDPALIAKVEEYGSVYFTGGDQSKLLAALKPGGIDSPLLKAIRKAHSEGGLLAGSSAGAAMMSDPMIVGGTSYEAMFHGYTDNEEEPGLLLGRGMGFFPHGLVDQHVIKRGRLARMVVAMAHAKVKRAFGVDENTAMVIDGQRGQVVGEYGVFFLDTRDAKLDPESKVYDDVKLSYVDDGDSFTLPGFVVQPSEAKRRVRKTEIAYRAPARSQRNAFGAYAIYDLIARIVLGDQTTYASDTLSVIDPKTKAMASATIRRKKGVSRCLIADLDDGIRMTALNLRLWLDLKPATDELMESREKRGIRTFGMDLNERSRIILLGSSPLYTEKRDQQEIISLIGQGPVGIFAAASAEARRTAQDHVDFFRDHGVEAVDLGITIDNVDYAEKNPSLLHQIEDSKALFLCGGNQIRLVETLLHRGEESAVLRSIARAYANGATIVASSGAVSALSRLMIAGGSSYEAMRYGVASDLGHEGLVIQEGVGLLAAGVADQNIISGRRLGRLIIACAEENEPFGIGVCDESAVIAQKSGYELTASGRYGFVLVDTRASAFHNGQDGFVAKDVRIQMFGPGDKVNLTSEHVERLSSERASAEVFDRLLDQIRREGIDLGHMEKMGAEPSKRHAIRMRLNRDTPLSATLDLECSREEHDA